MENQNFFSLIKNSEETHTSCLKTITVMEDDSIYTKVSKLAKVIETRKYNDGYQSLGGEGKGGCYLMGIKF